MVDLGQFAILLLDVFSVESREQIDTWHGQVELLPRIPLRSLHFVVELDQLVSVVHPKDI